MKVDFLQRGLPEDVRTRSEADYLPWAGGDPARVGRSEARAAEAASTALIIAPVMVLRLSNSSASAVMTYQLELTNATVLFHVRAL